MANPFDISNYESLTPKSPTVSADVQARIAANRAARAAAGATPSPAAAVADETAPLSRYARLKNILNPNITARGLARLGAGVAKTGAVGGVVGGAVQSIIDTPEEVANLGQSVGIDADTTGGRIGANIVNFAKNVGDYASFGVAPRLGRMLTGSSFFDPVAGTTTPAAPTASTNDGLPTGPQSPIAPSLGATPGVSRVAPADQASANNVLDGDYTGDLPTGTGFIRNNATGDTRVFRGGGASPTSNRAANDKFGFGQLITGLQKGHRQAAQTAALAAQGAYLRGEAAYMKAEEGNNKPENTTVIPSAIPGGKSEVIQVNRGVAKQLAVQKTLPPGWTEQTALDNTSAWLKKNTSTKDRAQAKQDLIDRGIDPARLPELR